MDRDFKSGSRLHGNGNSGFGTNLNRKRNKPNIFGPRPKKSKMPPLVFQSDLTRGGGIFVRGGIFVTISVDSYAECILYNMYTVRVPAPSRKTQIGAEPEEGSVGLF